MVEDHLAAVAAGDNSIKSQGADGFGDNQIEEYYSLRSKSLKRESSRQKRIDKKIKQLKLLKNPKVVVDCRIQIIEEERFLQVQLLDNLKEGQII